MKKSVPIKIKAQDETVLINGFPPQVDCRILSEDRYQEMISLIKKSKMEIWNVLSDNSAPFPLRSFHDKLFEFLKNKTDENI